MGRTEHGDTAGIPFPPPLAYLAGLAGGFGLHHAFPLQILKIGAGADALGRIGAGLIALGAVFAGSAFISLRRARTSPFPERPTTSLVVDGPFRLTRNPLYVSMTLVHAGVSLFANALWPLLFLVPALAAIRRFVIAREERYLLQRFGPAYQDYCGRVRRWL